jgi:hypothetical protein
MGVTTRSLRGRGASAAPEKDAAELDTDDDVSGLAADVGTNDGKATTQRKGRGGAGGGGSRKRGAAAVAAGGTPADAARLAAAVEAYGQSLSSLFIVHTVRQGREGMHTHSAVGTDLAQGRALLRSVSTLLRLLDTFIVFRLSCMMSFVTMATTGGCGGT